VGNREPNARANFIRPSNDGKLWVGDILYAGGPRMNRVIDPHSRPETWVKVDPLKLPLLSSVR
jgi:hypothetical protein